MSPNQTEAALVHHWAILIALIAKIARHAAFIVRREQRLHVCQLLRVAEGLARRWLLLKAQMRLATAAPRPGGPPPAGQTRGGRRPAGPLLCLHEPDPALRPADFSDQPFFAPGAVPTIWTAPVRLDPLGLAPSGGRVAARAQALCDVMQRPDHHAARMARWLRRRAKRALVAAVRYHPLRVGRPPGARRRDRSCEAQRALWWLDKLARDSLVPGWVP